MGEDPFLRFTDRLGGVGVRYMITGSVAATVYGEPRFTDDVDVVLELRSDVTAAALCAAFPKDEFYCAPLEVLKVEARRRERGHFNIIDYFTGLKADIYLAGEDAFHAWAMERREAVILAGREVFFAPIIYVIVRKLIYYREGKSEKHLRDIANMLAISHELVDAAELDRWIAHFGVQAAWQEAERLPG